MLEVGCGWGSFAIRAAQRTGCRVTGITVSKEQLAEATARVKAAGLADRVTLTFCDYRECPGAGTYDKVRGGGGLLACVNEYVVCMLLVCGAAAASDVTVGTDQRHSSSCCAFIHSCALVPSHLFCRWSAAR